MGGHLSNYRSIFPLAAGDVPFDFQGPAGPSCVRRIDFPEDSDCWTEEENDALPGSSMNVATDSVEFIWPTTTSLPGSQTGVAQMGIQLSDLTKPLGCLVRPCGAGVRVTFEIDYDMNGLGNLSVNVGLVEFKVGGGIGETASDGLSGLGGLDGEGNPEHDVGIDTLVVEIAAEDFEESDSFCSIEIGTSCGFQSVDGAVLGTGTCTVTITAIQEI